MSKAFFQGYVECAVWSSTNDAGEPLDQHDGDFSAETLANMAEDCTCFEEANAEDLEATGASDERNGHDFWLTRNGHGAGFWDRGYGEVGDRLSAAAKVWGSVDLYIGDDGQIHG